MTELQPQGFEVVTVALDTGGAEAAGPWIDAANAEHPSLIDEAHRARRAARHRQRADGRLDRRGGHARAPARGRRIPGTSVLRDMLAEHGMPEDAPPLLVEMLRRGGEDPLEPERYAAALRDWAARAPTAASRSRPTRSSSARGRARPRRRAAAAHFELGQHLHRAGRRSTPPARTSARRTASHPDNWTYKRQAWSFDDPLQGPTEHYDGDWLSDVRATAPRTTTRCRTCSPEARDAHARERRASRGWVLTGCVPPLRGCHVSPDYGGLGDTPPAGAALDGPFFEESFRHDAVPRNRQPALGVSGASS